MKTFYGLENIKSDKLRRSVVTAGVFDGVHLGHRLLLEKTVRKARSLGSISAVVTFWPHPSKSAFICTLEKRLKLISELGVDYCLVLPFTAKFARISPDDFISKIILPVFDPVYLLVGRNFTFGKDARGTPKLLKMASLRSGFGFQEVDIRSLGGSEVSSTLIRELITRGELNKARKLLGRRFDLEGKVIRARKVGRSLGFPTANIDYMNEILPPDGVYAAYVKVRGRVKKGACYIGTTPTFSRRKERTVEVFIIGFHGNIYGAFIEIELVKRLRADKKFRRIPDLVSAIKEDISAINAILKHPYQ